ncbi:penicillin-binding protein 1C [Chitinophaga sp. GCM10012297]|uniref:peptidoglycan glycosyltransferase n=1 Tax=Chitinophaga chungangae TaxID=2821488 RepID=A0ABS3YIH4_9BACT|nr:penicillin-binding protein 1C [Chitinophaga chungangae]MBO9154485.1 penicillin-binding protein 1C [Chitinophaga chungangae]
MREKIKQWVIKRKWRLSILAGLLLWYYFLLPAKLFTAPTSFVIEDMKGELMNAAIAKDGQWRFPADKLVPEKFEKCIVAYEDKRFFYHWGIDPLATARAIRQNLGGGRVVSGASTITMQVIRLYRNQPRTFWQKTIEMILATRLEFRYSKREILGLYAGNAPFGGNVVGLEAASWRYYGRKPDQLSWAETATLAVLPNSPALIHPGRNRQVLLDKRNSLLQKLWRNGTIDSSTCALACIEPLPDKPHVLPQYAPHLLNRFRQDYTRERSVNSTRLKTSLDGELQENVNEILLRHHHQLRANGINNAAALVLDVETGHALAYVGNVYNPDNPELESFVDIIQAPRSPGSTLKPLLYAGMLNDGLMLPHTLLPDVPTQIAGYTPQNFDQSYDGGVPASRALARSLNIPAVKLLQQYRSDRFLLLLKKLGISTMNKPAAHYGLSMILGGGETSLWELTGAYASMARTLLHLEQYNGKYDADDYHAPGYRPDETLPSRNSLSRFGVLDAGAIWYTFQAMEEVMRPGEEFIWQAFASSKRIAWKTGTSFGFRDGWAIGVTPTQVVGVWVGNADGEGRPGLTGVSTAAPIMFDIFRLLPGAAPVPLPADKLQPVLVCRQSGYRAGEYCLEKDTLPVPAAGLRSAACPYHQLIHLDASGQYRVTADCEAPHLMQHKAWFVLPPAMEHFYRMTHAYEPLPPFKPGCGVQEQGRSMELIYPRPAARIFVPVEIDGTLGETVFKATHRQQSAKIFWHLDEHFIGVTTDFHQVSVRPAPGRHTITLVDEDGEEIRQGFEILDKATGK